MERKKCRNLKVYESNDPHQMELHTTVPGTRAYHKLECKVNG